MGQVGFPPFSVLVVGHVVLKDENHLVWGEKVSVFEIAESAWGVKYPVKLTGILEEAVIDAFGEFVAYVAELFAQG